MFTVGGMVPIAWPRVPGHECVGVIDMLGAGVEGWTVGQRVGVGFRRFPILSYGPLAPMRHSEPPATQGPGTGPDAPAAV
jgi:NADPH:quinone reductase-like Zn-dependent oxidoreductase